MRRDQMLGTTMLIAGLAIAGLALSQMGPQASVHAQATSPSTSPVQNNDAPVESRPTTPAPEPARPQNMPDATPNSTTGTSTTNNAVQPALPPAPAEKMGEPIRAR